MVDVNLRDLHEKWALTVKVLLLVVIPGLIIQYYVRSQGLNILDMNIIIASLLTGAVFLIGFMLAGILQDFKESEQLLNNVANCVLAVQDHNRIEPNKKKRKAMLEQLVSTAHTIKQWLQQEVGVEVVYDKMTEWNDYFAKFDIDNCASWMEENQKTLRQNIMRIDVIKNTMFIKAGYTIMEIISAAVIVLILFSQTDTFILGAATYAASSFTLVYMILLIRDMDDPFEFTADGKKQGAAEVSMLPIEKMVELLEAELNNSH